MTDAASSPTPHDPRESSAPNDGPNGASSASVDRAARPAPPLRTDVQRTSGPAIAATAALVLFSVFIGIYGPRLGNRQQMPAGTTLVELAGAVQPKHTLRLLEARDGGNSQASRGRADGRNGPDAARDAEDRAARADEGSREIGHRIALPSLDGRRATWAGPEKVRVPGASGVLYFVRATPVQGRAAAGGPGPLAQPAYATLLFLVDEDRFTVFDHFGRPRAMPEGEVFSVAVSGATGATNDSASGSGTVHFFRSGAIVFGVQATDAAFAAELVAELEVLAVENPANGDGA